MRDITFGAFIRQKRLALENAVSLRKMAELLGLSPVHMSNIETGRDSAPRNDVLVNLARLLKLDKREQELMYDLAAESKNYKTRTAVPGDLPEYISKNEYAKIALRMARDVDATDQEWMEFIEKLRKRSVQEDKTR
jgi:transcriptional regulator with XRE-family HTH domain